MWQSLEKQAGVETAIAPDLTLVAHLPPGALPEAGTRLTLSAAIDDLRIFPGED